MVASSGAKLLQDDAVEALVDRLFPLATVVTPNLMEARRSPGEGTRRELAERIHELGAPAVIVTGGHGDDAVDHLFDGVHARRDPGRAPRRRRHARCRMHPLGHARGAARARPAPRGGRPPAAHTASRAVGNGLSRSAAEKDRSKSSHEEPAPNLAAIRERKPLVHQITNYVVMNETANATLALGVAVHRELLDRHVDLPPPQSMQLCDLGDCGCFSNATNCVKTIEPSSAAAFLCDEGGVVAVRLHLHCLQALPLHFLAEREQPEVETGADEP